METTKESRGGCCQQGLVHFEEVRTQELHLVAQRRARTFGRQQDADCRYDLIGLALSGGGIRSAATNIGVLTELSRIGLFRCTDYLSTVSGGGYIGGGLSSLLSLRDPGQTTLMGQDCTDFTPAPPGGSGSGWASSQVPALFSTDWNSFPLRDYPVEDEGWQAYIPPVQTSHVPGTPSVGPEYDQDLVHRFSARQQILHLRNRSSYLITRTLPFGAQTLKAIGAVLASTFMSLCWFFSWVLCLTTMYLLVASPAYLPGKLETTAPAFRSDQGSMQQTLETRQMGPWEQIETQILFSRMLDHWHHPTAMDKLGQAAAKVKLLSQKQVEHFPGNRFTTVLLGLAGLLWGLFTLPIVRRCRFLDRVLLLGTAEDREALSQRLLMRRIFIVNAFIGLGCYGLFLLVSHGVPLGGCLLVPVVFFLTAVLGGVVRLCLQASGSALWTRAVRNESYLGIGVHLYSLIGLLVLAVLPACIYASSGQFAALLLAGLILMVRGLLPFYRQRDKGQEEGLTTAYLLRKFSGWLLALLFPLFLVLAIIGTASLLMGVGLFPAQWPQIDPSWGWRRGSIAFLAFLVFVVLAVVISRLDFNRLSPHAFYCDRLAEAFLATFGRYLKPDAPGEVQMQAVRNSIEMPITSLHGNDRSDLQEGWASCAARGPYLLINATLNLTASRDLKGYQRQADNFLFSRLFTGSDSTGYVPSTLYAPAISLARAITISGAALTTVMGAAGNLLESFVCTIFGVRLGCWLPNPKLMQGGHVQRWSMRNLFYEMIRYTTARHPHVYLSDGGHCGDNLGILPLLRRRAKLIIASDAECDRHHVFDALNNSIRRAYVDHGIKIRINLAPIIPKENGFVAQHFALGRILYPDRPWQKSWLLVLKNGLCVNDPAPLLNYRQKSPQFPHEMTADQFFTEEQFESYRQLGRLACSGLWQLGKGELAKRTWRSNPWSGIDAFCMAIADQDVSTDPSWDDGLAAVWQSEQGDFSSWESLRDSLGRLLRVEGAPPSGESLYGQLEKMHGQLETAAEELDTLSGADAVAVPRNNADFIRGLAKVGVVFEG